MFERKREPDQPLIVFYKNPLIKSKKGNNPKDKNYLGPTPTKPIRLNWADEIPEPIAAQDGGSWVSDHPLQNPPPKISELQSKTKPAIFEQITTRKVSTPVEDSNNSETNHKKIQSEGRTSETKGLQLKDHWTGRIERRH